MIGIPQPYSIFVDEVLLVPGVPWYIEFLLWLADEEYECPPALNEVTDPIVQNAMAEVDKSQQTYVSTCSDFEQGTQCNGTIMKMLPFTSFSREECMSYCEGMGSHCCEWYQRPNGYKFCTASMDCFAQPSSLNSINGSYCAECNSTFIPSQIYAIQIAQFQSTLQYIGVDDCPSRVGFCNLLSLQVYPRLTNVWYLRITVGESLTIQPFVSPSMWGTVGVTVEPAVIATTLIGTSVLCGYFDISAWYYTYSNNEVCGKEGHSLRRTNYSLRICNDSETSVFMMEKIGDEGKSTDDVQWESAAYECAAMSATWWAFILIAVLINFVVE